MPVYTGSIVIANLETAEKYAAGFEVECWDSARTTKIEGPKFSPVVYNSGTERYKQKTALFFDGLTWGTTYSFRCRVVTTSGGPASTWSGWVDETAGDTTPPGASYTPSWEQTPGGVICTVSDSAPASDLDHYDWYWNTTGSTPSSTATPNAPATLKGAVIKQVFGAAAGVTVYAWLRAVGTGGNKQAWVSVGSETSQSALLVGSIQDTGATRAYNTIDSSHNLLPGSSASVKVFRKSGVPADGDFTNPVDGLVALDISVSPPDYYVRTGGTWVKVGGGGGGGGSTPSVSSLAEGCRRTSRIIFHGHDTTAHQEGEIFDSWDSGGGRAINPPDAEYKVIHWHARTGASVNNEAGMFGSGNNQFRYRVGAGIRFGYALRLDQTSAMRIWITLQSVGVDMGLADIHDDKIFVAFRYSTAADDTTWQCVSGDGVAQGLSDSNLAVDTNPHTFEFRWNDAGPSVGYYIDGILKATRDSNLPASGTNLRFYVVITTLEAANKKFECAGVEGSTSVL